MDLSATKQPSAIQGHGLIGKPMAKLMSSGTQPIRIMIADDHTLFRTGLRGLLEAESGLKVVGDACDGKEAVTLAHQLKPDILLLDLRMRLQPTESPTIDAGLEALRNLSTESNPVRVIVLTAEANKDEIVKALQLGALGLVLKDAATELLLTAIQTVMMGGYWVGREKVSNLMQYLTNQIQASRADARKQTYGLTPREMDIISAVLAGYANKEIADYFDIAEDTVKRHLANIFDKAGVSTRLELALFAVHKSLPLKTIGEDGQQSNRGIEEKRKR